MSRNISLDERLHQSVSTRIHSESEDTFDIYEELEEVLNSVGLSAKDANGKVTFYGKDPIVPSTIRLGAGSAIGLMAESVAAAKIWQLRGGTGQDITTWLSKAIDRLSPTFRMTDRLNGFPACSPDFSLLELVRFYQCKDGHFVLPMNVSPKLRNKMQGLFGMNNLRDSIAEALGKYTADELEDIGAKQGIVMAKVRTLEEFMKEPVYQEYMKDVPLIEIEKIADGDPEPLSQNARMPLTDVRALGLGHIIAGAGTGRSLASFGADVLNIWRLNEYDPEISYLSADVGLRSATVNYLTPQGLEHLKGLLKDADIFFHNRRPALIEQIGMTAEECAKIRPGIIYCEITAHGNKGPWAGRPGFDQVAGAVTGMMTFEGEDNNPVLPCINVVNDFLTSWFAATGIMVALMRRATEGGSYRVHVSLSRISLFLLSLGIFDKAYMKSIAGTGNGHELLTPNFFSGYTALGLWNGLSDQVEMSQTPRGYSTLLEARGAGQAVWMPKDPGFVVGSGRFGGRLKD